MWVTTGKSQQGGAGGPGKPGSLQTWASRSAFSKTGAAPWYLPAPRSRVLTPVCPPAPGRGAGAGVGETGVQRDPARQGDDSAPQGLRARVLGPPCRGHTLGAVLPGPGELPGPGPLGTRQLCPPQARGRRDCCGGPDRPSWRHHWGLGPSWLRGLAGGGLARQLPQGCGKLGHPGIAEVFGALTRAPWGF